MASTAAVLLVVVGDPLACMRAAIGVIPQWRAAIERVGASPPPTLQVIYPSTAARPTYNTLWSSNSKFYCDSGVFSIMGCVRTFHRCNHHRQPLHENEAEARRAVAHHRQTHTALGQSTEDGEIRARSSSDCLFLSQDVANASGRLTERRFVPLHS
uniref:Secreted protein n=1 Tax=Plectus sambesii TaxID=2011161 RepID=A0A914UT23_9BILA